VDDHLNRSVDISPDIPRVSTVLEVRHAHEMVVAYGWVSFWYDVDLREAVLDDFTF
jgi:hypothetical protein